MRCFLLPLFYCLLHTGALAQNNDTIIAQLQSVHQGLRNTPCLANNTPLITNRAMNVFLADKVGYLSESTDLSLYTNYVTLNAVEGKLTVNHNFQQKAKSADEPIKRLFSAGIWGSLSGRYAATSLDKSYETELGIILGYKWLGKVKTLLNDCSGSNNGKQVADAMRASIVQQLVADIHRAAIAFEASLLTPSADDLLSQNTDSVNTQIRKIFYADLQQAYEQKFAMQQAVLLSETKLYKQITTSWNSIQVSVPVLLPVYNISSSLADPIAEKRPFNLGLSFSHTRLSESRKMGKLFLSAGGMVFINQSKWSYALYTMNKTEYLLAGGRDSIKLATLKNEKIHIGDYKSFITPAVKLRLVYFPKESHVGFSFSAEQNFGQFNTLNTQVSLPVVLINSKKTPAVTIEFALLLSDMTHKLPIESTAKRTMIRIQAGIPLSRLMF